jgi:hypothetical protein
LLQRTIRANHEFAAMHYNPELLHCIIASRLLHRTIMSFAGANPPRDGHLTHGLTQNRLDVKALFINSMVRRFRVAVGLAARRRPGARQYASR